MLRRLSYFAILTCHVVVLLMALFPGSVRFNLRPETIGTEQGKAYLSGLDFGRSVFFTVSTDGFDSGAISRLVLTENGNPLGPAHASHSVIREKGGGAYSHWRNELWFSTSDGSDPRSNGRIYVAEARRDVRRAVLAGLAVLDLIAIWFGRRSLARTARRLASRRRVLLPIALACMTAPALALLPSLLGLGGPIGRNAALSEGMAVAGSVLVHALLGLSVAACVWLSGTGAAVLVLRGQSSAALVLALGFPLGAVIVGVASILVLVAPAGGVLAAVCVLAPALALSRWRPQPGERRAILKVALQATGFAFALALAFGMAWRGPLAGSPSTLSGDMTFFSATIVNLSLSPFPFRNLGSEGEFFIHLGSLLLLVGAAMHRIFSADPSLFLSSSIAAFYTMSVSLAVAGFLRARSARLDMIGIGIVALGAIAAGRYPSWITESPAVALAVPFGISILTLSIMPGGPVINRVLPLLIVFPATITSKAAAGFVFSAVAASGVAGDVRRLPRKLLITLGVLAFALAVLGAGLIGKFWAMMLAAHGIGPESRDMVMRWNAPLSAVWPYALRDLAVLPLAACLLRSQPWALAAALGLALLLGIVVNTFMIINFVIAVVAAALLMGSARPAYERERRIALIAIAMCVPAILFTDPAGLETGVPWVWAVALGGAAVSACLARSTTGGRPAAMLTYASAAASAAALLALAAFAAGAYRPLPVTHSTPGPITTEVADIWRAVRERTPSDALIFTDQTSAEPTMLGGWNTFSANGGRQVFLSNYYQSSELRNDPAARDAKLDLNRRVLTGALSPDQLSLSRQYSSYFAVMSNVVPAPQFRLIAKNAAWSLYEIKTGVNP